MKDNYFILGCSHILPLHLDALGLKMSGLEHSVRQKELDIDLENGQHVDSLSGKT